MLQAMLQNLSRLDPIGQLLLVVIGLCFFSALACHVVVRQRYAQVAWDLRVHGQSQLFESRFLGGVLNELQERVQVSGRLVDPNSLNTQAIIEHQFNRHLSGSLLAERFVRSANALVIVLGLLGTFYGLTLAIGKLVGLVAGDGGQGGVDFATVLMRGLSQTLGGMSVAFTTSLGGITAAVVLTVVGIISNLTDRRTALMLQVETYLDRLLASAPGLSPVRQEPTQAMAAGGGVAPGGQRLEQSIDTFRSAVGDLQSAVLQFEVALQHFSGTTRDFREFNLHLKDNVQRMSLSFGDFSEALKSQVERLRPSRGSGE
jgi:hypothetical protein